MNAVFHWDLNKWKQNIRNFQSISFHLEIQKPLIDNKKSDKKLNYKIIKND